MVIEFSSLLNHVCVSKSIRNNHRQFRLRNENQTRNVGCVSPTMFSTFRFSRKSLGIRLHERYSSLLASIYPHFAVFLNNCAILSTFLCCFCVSDFPVFLAVEMNGRYH